MQKIFLWILNHGPASLYEIHIDLKISEGTIYKILNELENYAYISEYKKEMGKTRLVIKYGPTILGIAAIVLANKKSQAHLGKCLEYWKNNIRFQQDLVIHGFDLGQLNDKESYSNFKNLFKDYIDYLSKVLENIEKFLKRPQSEPLMLMYIGEQLLIQNEPKYITKFAKLCSGMPGIRTNYNIGYSFMQDRKKEVDNEIKKLKN